MPLQTDIREGKLSYLTMSRDARSKTLPSDAEATSPHRKAVLVGSPNVGKSVIFHALTGKYATVSNFPGTTVEIMEGKRRIGNLDWQIYDTPGVTGFPPRTDDERVTRDVILKLKPDVIVQVADAKNLPQTLLLTLGLLEFGRPMLLVLNMSDERMNAGIFIDTARLAEILGIPVIETVAIAGQGIKELTQRLDKPTLPRIRPHYDPVVLRAVEALEENFPDPSQNGCRAMAVSLFSGDESAWNYAAQYVGPSRIGRLEADLEKVRSKFVRNPEILILEARRQTAQEIVGEVQSTAQNRKKSLLDHLGNWSMRPFPGYLFAGFALFILYEFVGVFGAGTLVRLLEVDIFGNIINPFMEKWVKMLIPFGLLQEALVGEYGVITMALTYALALILPIVTTFFLFFGFLEDSGYLPRLAVILNRLFRLMGLNGRAVVPMILGLGCGTMATVTTRILNTKREKLIVSILLTLSVPCSAQLGAVFGMAAGASWKVLLIWFSVVSGTMFLVGWGAARLLPGSRSPLLMDIPPIRMPKISNILKKVQMRLIWYGQEVIPLFVLATFILFLLDKLGVLKILEYAMSPIVVNFLGLPAKATEAFLLGFLRRDYGAAGFFSMAQQGLMNARQITVSMVVITLFMPCFAHLLVTVKERGQVRAAGIFAFVLSFALLMGGSINWILLKTAIL